MKRLHEFYGYQSLSAMPQDIDASSDDISKLSKMKWNNIKMLDPDGDNIGSSNIFTMNFDLGKLYKHREVPHLTFPEYEEYLNKSIDKKFAVTRDPVTRFVSQLRSSVFKDRIESIFKDQESLNKFINDALIDKNNVGNWFVPQIKFLDHKTKLWRFE